MDFVPTEGQAKALDMLRTFMRSRPPQVAILTGFAGTGKTTIIQSIASEYGPPAVLAPTGKAAIRVREATGLESSTIHKWLYKATDNEVTGETDFVRKPVGEIGAPASGLVVVDEASMVSRELYEDIFDVCRMLDLRLLLVGDTFQLPPVEKRAPNDPPPTQVLVDVQTPYRAHLWEVTRQALDSPILRASMVIRESADLDDAFDLLERVFYRKFDETAVETYRTDGVVIVHRNATRQRLNQMIRTQLGHSGYPQPGEPLLVRRNQYDLNLFNGEIVDFSSWTRFDPDNHVVVRDRYKNISENVSFGVGVVDQRVQGQLAMLCPEEVSGASQLGERAIKKASNRFYADWYAGSGEIVFEGSKYKGPPHLHCQFGYSLTAHSSQGSEWKHGLVLIEDSVRLATPEGRRWLYTSCTRFKDKCRFSFGN